MSFLTTDYTNTTTNNNGPLPEGDYEFIIKGVQEVASKGGSEAIQFELVVRNDLDQALPETNGKQHNRHLWVNEWKRRKTNEYDTNNLMYFMQAAGVPEGTNIDTIEKFFEIMTNKPVRIHIKVEKNEYQGNVTEVNRPAPWDWQVSKFPNVQHTWVKKDTEQAGPFEGNDTSDKISVPF